MLATEIIEKMSIAERLQAIEQLWMSLGGSDDEVKFPEWHREVLAARKAKVESGQAEFLSIDQVRARLAQRRRQ